MIKVFEIMMTSTIESSLSVGTVCIIMTIVLTMDAIQTFISIYEIEGKNWYQLL